MLCELKTNLLIMKEMQEAFTDAKLHIHAKGLDKCIKQTEETIKRAEG